MKKIFVNKNDSVPAVIEKIISSKENEITLHLSKGADLASHKNNLNLIKREASAGNKTVIIESSDDEIRTMAESLGIKANDPLLGRSKKLVSDIIPREGSSETRIVPETKAGKGAEASPEISADKAAKAKRVAFGLPKISVPSLNLSTITRPSLGIRKPILVLTALIVFFVLGYVSLFVLPKAQIVLVFQKINWNFDGSLAVNSNTKGMIGSANQITVPGESFVEKKNMTSGFPANGTKQIEKKATGKLTVYNAYSSSKQNLVKDTRFSTPDGKVFRLNASITIPGAMIENAKIVPSSVEVAVTADKPGADYNIEATPKFRIPGFQGTPKYDGFYGESKEAMTGGFVGEVKVPTEADIAAGRDAVHKALQDNLNTQISINLPKDIKILKNASEFVITKETIDETAGGDGKFNITTYAELHMLGFKEEDLLSALGKVLAETNKSDLARLDYALDYGESRLDFGSGKLMTSISFKSNWAYKFDAQVFRESARGKKETELKGLVLGLQGIKSGEVKLWPFYVTSAPTNENAIKVDVRYEL